MLYYCKHNSDPKKDCILDMTVEHGDYLNTASNGVWSYWPLRSSLILSLKNNYWDELFRILEASKHPYTNIWMGAYHQAKQHQMAGGDYREFENTLARIRFGVNEYINKLQ